MSKSAPNTKEHTVNPDAFLVSKTDLKGNITYCNQPFIKIVGSSEKELLGKPHNIVRHPDMPRIIFKLLWEKSNKKMRFLHMLKTSHLMVVFTGFTQM